MPIVDPYRVLGITPDASDAVIRAVYRALAREMHPDVNHGDPAKTERLKEINDAYDRVKTPELRKQTDENLRLERLSAIAAKWTEQAEAGKRTSAARSEARRTTGRPRRGVPMRFATRRRSMVPKRRAKTPLTDLAVAFSKSRPQGEAVWWVLGGALLDTVLAAAAVRR